jgi:hypothetical protein
MDATRITSQLMHQEATCLLPLAPIHAPRLIGTMKHITWNKTAPRMLSIEGLIFVVTLRRPQISRLPPAACILRRLYTTPAWFEKLPQCLLPSCACFVLSVYF